MSYYRSTLTLQENSLTSQKIESGSDSTSPFLFLVAQRYDVFSKKCINNYLPKIIQFSTTILNNYTPSAINELIDTLDRYVNKYRNV